MSNPQSTNAHAPRHRQQTGTPSTGSQTIVQTPASSSTQPEPGSAPAQAPILRLRGAHTSSGPRVQWAETVVDNEGLGRKSSKVCCIYHAPRAVGDSSSESSSDSSDDSSSDSDSDSGPRRIVAGGHGHDHEHGEGCSHHGQGDRAGRNAKRGAQGKRRRRPSPNAYEKQPKVKPRPGDGGGSGSSGPNARHAA
jgi:protein phosphatase 1 regulatory subunit 11